MAVRTASLMMVIAQIGLLLGLLLTGPLVPQNRTWLILTCMGLALGCWARISLKTRHLPLFPEPTRETQLATSGPYRWIRHPIYAAVLLITLCLVLEHLTVWRVVLWGALSVDIWFKLNYEEKVLSIRFPEYQAYARRSKRLIPFIL